MTDYESVGRGFESLPAYQKSRYPNGYLLFWYAETKELEKFHADVRWTSARRRLDAADTLAFRVPSGTQDTEIPFGYLLFWYAETKGLEQFNSTAQWAVDCRQLDGGNSLM